MSRVACENKHCRNLTERRFCSRCMRDEEVVKTCRCKRGKYVNHCGVIIPSCSRENCLRDAYKSLHADFFREKAKGKQFVIAERKRNEEEIQSLREKLVAKRKENDEIRNQLQEMTKNFDTEKRMTDELSCITIRHDNDMAELKRKHRSAMEFVNLRQKDENEFMRRELQDMNRKTRELEKALEDAQKTIVSLTAKNEVLSDHFARIIAPRSVTSSSSHRPTATTRVMRDPDGSDPRNKRGREVMPQSDADVEKSIDPTLHVMKRKKIVEMQCNEKEA